MCCSQLIKLYVIGHHHLCCCLTANTVMPIGLNPMKNMELSEKDQNTKCLKGIINLTRKGKILYI